MLRWLFACFLALLPLAGWSADPVALPALVERVVDSTGTLGAEDKAGLVARLSELEQAKGAQIAIVMLPTTQPESIEQFGIRLAEAWKIGRKGVDDGIIVIVAKDDRQMRIEVGYGLEGAIPDAIAKRIIDEQMVPRFREGDFAGGLRSTVELLAKAIDGEPLPAPKTKTDDSAYDSDTLLFVAIFVASIARALFGIAGSLAVSALAGWLAWMSFGSVIAALIAAAITFGASFLRSGGGGGGWHSGGGGRSGGGGFSGGGGSFGGGGASGRW